MRQFVGADLPLPIHDIVINYSLSVSFVFDHWINRVNATPIETPNKRINQKPASLGLLAILE